MLSRCESIQGKTLEVTVVSGNRLKDTEWLSRQDPYVLVKYGGTAYRTETCTDGGRSPTFCNKFSFKLFEGLCEVEISVYNSNILSSDDFIGSGKVYLEEVLSRGYQDSSFTLINNQRFAGEIRLILNLKYSNAQSSEAQLPPPPSPPSPKPFYQIPPPQHLHYPAYQPQYPPQQPPAYGPYAPHPTDPIYPPQSPYNGRYAPQQPPAYVPSAPHLPEPCYPPHSPYNDRYRRPDY